MQKEKNRIQDKYTEESYDAFKITYDNAKNIKENATTPRGCGSEDKVFEERDCRSQRKTNDLKHQKKKWIKSELQAKVDDTQ